MIVYGRPVVRWMDYHFAKDKNLLWSNGVSRLVSAQAPLLTKTGFKFYSHHLTEKENENERYVHVIIIVWDVTARTTNTWLLMITQKIVTESNMAMEDKCTARDVVWPPCYNFLCERLTARRTKHIFLIKNRLFSFRQCYATRTGPGYFQWLVKSKTILIK